MKKVFLLFATMLVASSASAQYYPDGRPIPPSKRNNYYNGNGPHDHDRGGRYDRRPKHGGPGDTYYGFHLGMAIASVHSDAPILDGSDPKVGLDVGFSVGTRIAPRTPLFFETGLSYTEKGGKGEYQGDKFTYSLDYLEVPLLLKYKYYASPGLSIEPFAGGYLALGVGGKIKDYGNREAYSSFGDDQASFKRFDGGIRIGCGLRYDLLHFGLSYDIGLANVGHYDFEDTRTGSLNLNVGVTF